MTTVRELHEAAMRHAQDAIVARHTGDVRVAQELAKRAYDLETQAIAQVPDDASSEPTLSILRRSAASLAYQFKDYQAAQRQIVMGLSGYPPPEIEGELKDLLRMIDFELHLESRDVLLEDPELEVSMEGKAVGPGIIPLAEVTDRLRNLGLLISRTVSRMSGSPYQRAGRLGREARQWTPVLSAPRTGSLVLSLKLGTPASQQPPLWPKASEVIDEIVKGVELIEQANDEALRRMIAQENYYVNFVTLTSAIAPDGERVRFVGFASRSRTAILRRPEAEIQEVMLKPAEEEIEVQRERVEVRGQLDYADSRRARDLIGLKTAENERWTVLISEGMDDIVRTHYGSEVVVRGTRDPGSNELTLDYISEVRD